jgi:hypothetical protein
MNTPTQPPAPEFAGHTPGPWHTNMPPGRFPIYAGKNGEWTYIASAIDGTKEEKDANARLIAAAPTLLAEVATLKAQSTALRAALELALAYFDKTAPESGRAVAARAALAGSALGQGVQS